MERARFGFFPELRTPQLPAAHVRAGTGLEHWPGATSPTSRRSSNHVLTHNMPPRVAHPRPSHHRRTTAYALPSKVPDLASSLRENNQRPNETVLTSRTRRTRTTSQQRSTLPASQQGHGLSAGLRSTRAQKVLTCQRLPAPSLPYGDSVALIRPIAGKAGCGAVSGRGSRAGDRPSEKRTLRRLCPRRPLM
jgi:hypothetical protein